MAKINTEKVSLTLRRKGIDLDRKAILITNFKNSEQEKDLTVPANCNGFGRVRHFRLSTGENWSPNPLPILPAAKALGLKPDTQIRAQVFQNAICNWRCWYCFVDFKLLSGNRKYSDFLTCTEMIELYLQQENPPLVIDLSGGQPDLTPEWIPWMMEALMEKGLSEKVYLWSDDNLSNDYLWKYVPQKYLDLMAGYKMYGRVSCFKGIDEESFALNTGAEPKLFKNQLLLFQRLLDLGLDLYAYVTMTAKLETDFQSVIPKFLDNLQRIDENIPLRVVPLKVFEFTPVKPRMKDVHFSLINGQNFAFKVWDAELKKRFPKKSLSKPITDIPLGNK